MTKILTYDLPYVIQCAVAIILAIVFDPWWLLLLGLRLQGK